VVKANGRWTALREASSRVEIYPRDKSGPRWVGTVTKHGVEMSAVRVTAGPDEFIGRERYFLNADLAPLRGREKMKDLDRKMAPG
jgi:hypothetical protein